MTALRAGVLGAAAVWLSACSTTAAAREPRIGYIDVPRILEEFEGFRDARKELEKSRESREEEFMKRARELQKSFRDYQESARLLSDAKKREKEAELLRRQQELDEWRRTQTRELQEREEGLVKRLEGDVRRVLESIAKAAKLDFVVRKDLFLYVQEDAVDLTDRVLSALRKQAK